MRTSFIVLISISFIACTGNTFQRTPDKQKESENAVQKEKKEDVADKSSTTDQTQSDSKSPTTPSIDRLPGEPEISEEEPKEEILPPLKEDPEPEIAQGEINYPVQAVQSMENGCSAVDAGFRVILKNGSGKTMVAGPINIEAVQNGVPLDAPSKNMYTVTSLKTKLPYMNLNLLEEAGGKGTIYLCKVKDMSASWEDSECTEARETKPSSSGLANGRTCQHPKGIAVGYALSGESIKIKSYNGVDVFDGGAPVLITNNPLYASIAGEKKTFNDLRSPLVIDLNNDSKLNLIDAWDKNNKVMFDSNNDGQKVKTGWISKGEGLLVLDINGNSVIDDGAELFGEYSAKKRFSNGFAALSIHDQNLDGKITKKDSIFSKLKIWTDSNLDGSSQKSELKPLSSYKISEISLAYKKGLKRIKGNEARLFSKVKYENGKTTQIVDVWFQKRSGISLTQYLAQ